MQYLAAGGRPASPTEEREREDICPDTLPRPLSPGGEGARRLRGGGGGGRSEKSMVTVNAVDRFGATIPSAGVTSSHGGIVIDLNLNLAGKSRDRLVSII